MAIITRKEIHEIITPGLALEYPRRSARLHFRRTRTYSEAIAFSIIAGVGPKVGQYASFSIAVVTAFAGGRPGVISAAMSAMALVMATLVKVHGLLCLLAATIRTRRQVGGSGSAS